MQGRIKAGEGTLIGNAGEFCVAAELLEKRHLTYSRHEQNLKPYHGNDVWDAIWTQ